MTPQTGDCTPRHSAAVQEVRGGSAPNEAWSAARGTRSLQVPYLGTARLACVTCHRMRETTPVSACARRRAAAQAYSLGKSRACEGRRCRCPQGCPGPASGPCGQMTQQEIRGRVVEAEEKARHKEDPRVDGTVAPVFTCSLRDPWELARFCLCGVLFAVLPWLLTCSVEREVVDRWRRRWGPDFDCRSVPAWERAGACSRPLPC